MAVLHSGWVLGSQLPVAREPTAFWLCTLGLRDSWWSTAVSAGADLVSPDTFHLSSNPNHPIEAVQAPETEGKGRALPRTRPPGHRRLSAAAFQRPQRQSASSGSVPNTEAEGKQLAGGGNSGTWPGPALGATGQGLVRLTHHRMSPEAYLTTSSAPVTEHRKQDSKQKQAWSLFIGNWLKVRHSEHGGLLELAVVWLPSASVQRKAQPRPALRHLT